MPKAGLDQQQIVVAALELVDEVGLDRLSTRLIADRLGVRSPALYWHFRAKADVVAAMAEAMTGDLPDAAASLAALGPQPDATALESWLIARAQAFRRVLLSRRDGARIHAGTRPAPAQQDGVEAQLAALHGIGLDVADAARVTLAISRFVVGWVLEEQADQAERAAREGSSTPQSRPSVERPLVLAAFRSLDGQTPEAVFSTCLAGIVRGLLTMPGTRTEESRRRGVAGSE